MSALWVGVLVAAAGCYTLKLTGLSMPRALVEHPVAERVADLTVRHRMRHLEELLGAIAVWSELLTAARRRRSALAARL